MKKLSLKTRLTRRVASTMGVMMERAVGYQTPILMREMFEHYGFFKSMQVGRHVSKAIEHVVQRYGDRDAQLLIGFAALWKGCSFCSVGHTLAANLHHLQNTGQLFPISEDNIHDIRVLRDKEAMAQVSMQLSAPEYDRIRGLLERQLKLILDTAEGETSDDPSLRVANAAWDFVVECSLFENTENIPPLSPIAKDKAILARYRHMRSTEQA